MLGLVIAFELFGLIIYIRGMTLEHRNSDRESKELSVSAVIYGEEIMEEEDEIQNLPEDEKDAIALENNKQLVEWKQTMKKLRAKAGVDVYDRILFDAALARNLAAFSVIGNPVNPMKGFVDSNYGQISSSWGNGYPRVLPEVLLKTYTKPEGYKF